LEQFIEISPINSYNIYTKSSFYAFYILLISCDDLI